MSSIRGMLSQKASAASNAEFHRYVVSSGPLLKAVINAAGLEDLPTISASVMHVLWSLHLDRLIAAPLLRACIQQDIPATFPAGGSETLREESVNMRLLSEYLRVHGLDFLKKVLHEPLQKVASGRYNEDFKRNTLTAPINDILNGMLALERELPGPVHECLMNGFHFGESQGGKGNRAINFIYLVMFIFPMMRNPHLLGVTGVSGDYQDKITRVIDTWLQVLGQEAPASPKVAAWTAVLTSHSLEEELALCARRQKRLFESVLQRLAKIDREKKKRPLSPEQLGAMTTFCRKNEEQICRALHALDFGDICVYQFRVLLAAEPVEESRVLKKKAEAKKESVTKLFEPLEPAPSKEREPAAILYGWAQRWTQEKQIWRKCYVALTPTVLRLQEAESPSDRDRTVPISSIYEVREAADDCRLIIGCSGGRKEYMLRFGDKKELYMWKANLGETRRVLSTELNPAILLDHNDIEVGSAIARGGEGTIYKGMFRTTTHAAIKTVAAYNVDARGVHTEKFPKDILILGQLDHPNVLPLIGYARRPDEFLIVTPWIDMGNLSDLLAKDRSPFTETLICTFGYEIASGMAHIHSRGLLHRDLKTQNLLVKSIDPAAPVHVLIADFGTARSLDEEVFTKNPGTLVYEAPETHSGVYDEKVDVYSFGMCIWEMYSGQLPWAGEKWTAQILQKVVNGERPAFPDHCPETARRIIHSCWNTDPKERPSFSALVETFRALRLLSEHAALPEGARSSTPLRGSSGSLASGSELNLARVLASRLVARAHSSEVGETARSATASPHRSVNSSTSSSLETEGVLFASYGPPASRAPSTPFVASPLSSSPKAPLRSWAALLQAAGFEASVVELYSAAWAAVPVPKTFAEIPFDELKEIEGTRVSHLKVLRKWIKTQQP